jgi:uncharacterized protein YbcI
MDPNVESRISERLFALHAHLLAKRPSAARTYIAGDDAVVVVLEETFTPAERAWWIAAKRRECRTNRRPRTDRSGLPGERHVGDEQLLLRFYRYVYVHRCLS